MAAGEPLVPAETMPAISKGDKQMSIAKDGDCVKVHYTGKLGDGTVFDSSDGKEPLEFTIGGGEVIPGFEVAVPGMSVGDKKQILIPAADAYGQSRDDLLLTVDRNQFPENIVPEIGQQLELRNKDGMPLFVTVAAFTDTEVTLDANHPLAGKDLTFDIELVQIG
jgi:peptidylprolyl isomerase